MELSKHKNHRNPAYLSWLRQQECVITEQKAQCAHHIRLGTNGGSSIKPSDYFCIPLLNEYHTTGLFALHIIGEDSFFKQFKLNRDKLFIGFLKQYLIEEFDTFVQLENKNEEKLIAYMIKLIEEKGPKFDKPRKKTKPKKISDPTVIKKSITENEFYQKAKEEKKIRDRQLRMKLKEVEKSSASEVKSVEKRKVVKPASSTKKSKTSLTQSEFYQKAKEFKRERDKELRAKLKLSKKTTKTSVTQTEYYQQAKELKRIRDKEFRQKLKEQRKNT